MSLIRFLLPLTTLAISVVFAAADGFCQEIKNPGESGERTHRVVASGRLLGTNEIQQIVSWQSRGYAYLAVETGGRNARKLWQAEGRTPGSRVDSVRLSDLDGDRVPEIVSLWWNRSPLGAELRVVHWDSRQGSFIEIQSESDIGRVNSYRIVRGADSSRIVVDTRSNTRGDRTTRNVAYELRGSKLIRVSGGQSVTTQVESGIEGQAVISPIRPGPAREGMANSGPYKTTLVVRGEGDREVARFETGTDGRFRVTLAPGTYRVGPPQSTGRFLPRAGEETVIVEPGKYAQVTIHFDSGMR